MSGVRVVVVVAAALLWASLSGCDGDGGASLAEADTGVTAQDTDAPPDDADTGDATAAPDADTDADTDTDTDTDTPPPTFTTPDGFCRPQAEWLCAQATACACQPSPLVPDEAACVARRVALCLEGFEPYQALLDAGEVVIPAAEVARCVEALPQITAPCDLPTEAEARPFCGRTLSGREPLGAACTSPVCADGAGVCADGTCQPVPAVGQACPTNLCAPDARCVDGTCRALGALGATCDELTSACAPPARCIDGTCALRAAPGGACAADSACAPGSGCDANACVDLSATACADNDTCGESARCLGTADRVCVPLSTQGGACAFTDDCAPGLVCAEGACQPAPAASEPCADGVYCGLDLACGFDDSLCAPIPGEGEPCALGVFGPFACAEGLGCVNGTCAPPPGEGQPCASGQPACADGLGCDFRPDAQGNSSICRQRQPAGSPCENDDICADGLFCDYSVGQCAPFFAMDDLCSLGNECGPDGACMPIAQGARTFVCKPLPQAGGACFLDCAQGTRCQTVEVRATCAPPLCSLLWQ